MDDVTHAARRLLNECELHEAEYGIEDSLLSFAQDIKTVASWALGASEEVERLRGSLREIICDLYAEDTTSAQRMDMAVRRARAAVAPSTVAPHDAAEGV